jgi:putative OPT family oligopeptide transporter
VTQQPSQGEAAGEKLPPSHFPATEKPRELSLRAIVLGLLAALVFGLGNVYCGLKIGMTVTAAISSVVIALAFIKGMRKGSIAECTIVQSIGSSGDAVLNGIIFTVPAMFLMALPGSESLWNIAVYAAVGGAIGGVLGILLMIPLRHFLVVREHKALPFPEGTACAKILVSGEKGGAAARPVIGGFLAGGLFSVLSGWLQLWKADMFWSIKSLGQAALGLEAGPVLMGVGYIIGLRTTLIMAAGGLLGWTLGIPLLGYLAGTSAGPALGLPPDLASMDVWDIAKGYLRYVGAGAMSVGGIIGALKALPMVVGSIAPALRGFGKKAVGGGAVERTRRDLPIVPVLVAALALLLLLWLVPMFRVGIVPALLLGVLTFLFVAVSARMVGLIGTSSQPVSGMTIAALMFSAGILYLLGYRELDGKFAALTVAVIMCVSICTSGNISQDLKTGFYIGNTPAKLQVAEIIGSIFASAAVVVPLFLFRDAIARGELPAPQATIIKTIIEGIMGGSLPWRLIILGGCIAAAIELWDATAGRLGEGFRISSLALAIGLYLPVSTSVTLIFGGLAAHLVARRYAKREAEYETRNEASVLYSSGLIAGAAICAVVYAVLRIAGVAGRIGLGAVSPDGELLTGLVARVLQPLAGPVASLGIEQAAAVAAFLLLGWLVMREAFVAVKK